ncbi:GIY-YIG nuclease family protein [Acinetobacter sichuanensis]|uniref:GIY-YIG nuclease family protein n=1 Tax=Acinetobacter sichuanensis TaxID=2136183 RepID=A0A371YUW6_9GAMM|nr:GIY-YIG nuclease family protein [Acinetobacter sichuanensis]RFC85261.1 GIY-YIG nuclease family protein [Acinetobacter sichuanensis]
MSNHILLNDLLNLEDINNTKIRFNMMFEGNWNPIELFQNGNIQTMLDGQYWNYEKTKSYKEGQITLGFVKINTDLWLLFHVGRITQDLNIFNGVGYTFENLDQYTKFCGRLIIRYKNKSTNLIRLANSVINQCEVYQILPDVFDQDIFPGYENVNISWKDLQRVITKEAWKTALKNQKAVYLLTDKSNGKQYVGSAYAENMLLNRWQNYIITRHGGNDQLKKLTNEHIENHFYFSILDIFKAKTDDHIILTRESWWKETLLTRRFGYNSN